MSEVRQTHGQIQVIDVEVEFDVWEAPLNHLNLFARLNMTCSRSEQAHTAPTITHALLEQSIGSVFSTHRQAIRQMNVLANRFTHELTAKVLHECAPSLTL